MSGPIVRKYGFPNFDDIFGKRELEHGVEDSDDATAAQPDAKPTDSAGKKPAKAPAKGKKKA